MEAVNITALERFKSGVVSVVVHGEQGEETPPSLTKTIKRLQKCPDQTHLRIYFDAVNFLAVPLTSDVKWTEKVWTAYDKDCILYYVIKKES
ncbi:hypothetical protein LIT25_19660 [Bacillus sp. F19]|nr:hypothetical protein LIT25_19660 [Bacillus sp. F19]